MGKLLVPLVIEFHPLSVKLALSRNERGQIRDGSIQLAAKGLVFENRSGACK